MLEVGVNGGTERYCALFPGTSCIFQGATEQHFGKVSLPKSGIIMGHGTCMSGSLDPGVLSLPWSINVGVQSCGKKPASLLLVIT